MMVRTQYPARGCRPWEGLRCPCLRIDPVDCPVVRNVGMSEDNDVCFGVVVCGKDVPADNVHRRKVGVDVGKYCQSGHVGYSSVLHGRSGKFGIVFYVGQGLIQVVGRALRVDLTSADGFVGKYCNDSAQPRSNDIDPVMA